MLTIKAPLTVRAVDEALTKVVLPFKTASEIVGAVPKTRTPEPVSSVTAASRLAELGVPRKVAILAARPETPVLIGKLVASVKSNAGVASLAPRAKVIPPYETVELASPALVRAPAKVLVKVSVAPEPVMVVEAVRPLKAVEEVAKVTVGPAVV